jgi:CBS domain containing-hemolysin-like protein
MDDVTIIILKLLGVFALVLLNGFFVAAEFAIVKVRDTQLESLIVKGHRRAKVARRLLANLDASLSATQLGITLASLGLGWFAEPVFTALLEPMMGPLLDLLKITEEGTRVKVSHSVSFAVGFSVITFLHIVAGELAPKSLAIQKPLPTTLFIAQPLLWFNRVSYPFIWGLNHTALWLLRRVGIEPVSEAELMHSEDELRLLFTSAHKHGGGSQLGRDIVLNAMDLSRRQVRDVMRPRQEITALSTAAPIAECLSVADQTRYSRFPLCENGDLDRTIGVVHIKDLYALRNKAVSGADLASVARRLIYVPETARLERVLKFLLDRKLHLAVVVDEYGSTTGLITMENILEELVGQIQDEFDAEKALVEKVGENQWELSGALPLHELEELIGDKITEPEVSTTSGLVTRRLGGFPKRGEKLVLGRFDLTVEEVDGVRVSKLRLTRRPDDAAAQI